MHRPWIKIETSTPDKPEICAIATKLRIDPDAVVGKLIRIWAWVEVNHIHSNDLGVTFEFIDKLVGHRGFAQAMAQTGWLEQEGEAISLPNFERHNGQLTKGRLMTAKRVKRHRLRKQIGNDAIVTNIPKPAKPRKATKIRSIESEEVAQTISTPPPIGASEVEAVESEPVATIPEAKSNEMIISSAKVEPLEVVAPNDESATKATSETSGKRKAKSSTGQGDQPLLF